MSFPESFLWGGATSSSQLEGGCREGNRGWTIQDVVTAGSNHQPRLFTYRNKDGSEGAYRQFLGTLPEGAQFEVLDGYYYPNHHAVDFYH
ncbi:MAG: family 1 glycosylhydrolase, partial [Bulleidia sp.]